jgi:hypothetical protein
MNVNTETKTKGQPQQYFYLSQLPMNSIHYRTLERKIDANELISACNYQTRTQLCVYLSKFPWAEVFSAGMMNVLRFLLVVSDTGVLI